ncbi:MAG TPA: hypothetical protein VHC45_15060 [Gaiellaceae bacterium]|nr:hypothetical protein [Gaiellaceae bacterium]
MRHIAQLFFDEFIPPSTVTTTSTQYDAVLSAYDQIALHFIVDDVTGTGRLDGFLDHSGDSKNWLQRNSVALGSTPPTTLGDVSVALSAGGVYQLFWADSCLGSTHQMIYTGTASPKNTTGTLMLPFARIRLVTQAGAGCHVKVFGTCRGAR